MRSGLFGFLFIVSNCAEILMTATLTQLAYEQKGLALHTAAFSWRLFQGPEVVLTPEKISFPLSILKLSSEIFVFQGQVTSFQTASSL